MVETSWTREENEKFKNALVIFSVFLPTRFKSIAEYVQKSVADVKEHYKEMVNDLLEMGSSRVAFPNKLTEAMAQSSYQAERTKWNKETHEWFLIGLKRFGKDWRKIAVLLDSKNPKQVEIYAHSYFNWQSSEKNVMKRPRANDITVANTDVNVMKRQRANDMVDTGHQCGLNGPTRESRRSSAATTHEPIVMQIGHHAKASNSK
ncbi:unnamed protein product [Arabidopsis arenosa]|uniref:Uncharacterized protein n=1 Tax=Arabidopsis arenosa TaxID=38785 RepID=A0A8S1ZZX7_ARAAE|nr:unnamed protein product [Arabidopsis arenosa]